MAKKKAVKKKTQTKKLGRPSKYKPEYCEMLIEEMGKGYSYEAFAGVISVDPTTIYEWEKHHVSFSQAKKEAFAASRLFWEKIAIDNIINKSDSFSDGNGGGESKSRSVNATVWIFNMKNRFGWRDKQPDEDKLNLTLNIGDAVSKARNRVKKKK